MLAAASLRWGIARASQLRGVSKLKARSLHAFVGASLRNASSDVPHPFPVPAPGAPMMLELEDGKVFYGRGFGHHGSTSGEVRVRRPRSALLALGVFFCSCMNTHPVLCIYPGGFQHGHDELP